MHEENKICKLGYVRFDTFLAFFKFSALLGVEGSPILEIPRGEKSRRVRSIGQKVRVDPPSETYGPAAEENRKAKNQNFFKSDPLARRTVSSEQPEVGKHAPAPGTVYFRFHLLFSPFNHVFH